MGVGSHGDLMGISREFIMGISRGSRGDLNRISCTSKNNILYDIWCGKFHTDSYFIFVGGGSRGDLAEVLNRISCTSKYNILYDR